MSNIELYNQSFIKSFRVNADQLDKLSYRSIPAWDSMGHMLLIAALEEAFNIIIDTNDIIDFGSYENGKKILNKYSISF
jgi:acyl carrier protein